MEDEGKTVEQATSTNVVPEGKELSEDIKKQIQSEVDRVRTKYVQQNKELEEKLKELEQSKMTDDEKRLNELQEKQSLIDLKEQEILKRELTLKAIQQLSEKKIPSDLAEFVIGENEEATDKRIDKLIKIWTESKSAVAETINQQIGRKPAESKSTEYTLEQLSTMSPEEINRLPKGVVDNVLRASRK